MNVAPLNIYYSASKTKSAPKLSKFKSFHGWAMINSGASSCFIHKHLIDLYNIPVTKKKSPRQLKVIDGREISSGLVDTECILKLSLGSHKEELVCNIAEIG